MPQYNELLKIHIKAQKKKKKLDFGEPETSHIAKVPPSPAAANFISKFMNLDVLISNILYSRLDSIQDDIDFVWVYKDPWPISDSF